MRTVVEGRSLVEIVQARTDVGTDAAVWYVELGIELGLLGAVSIETGERVTIDRSSAAEPEA